MRDFAPCPFSSVGRFVRRAAARTSGLPGTPGYATRPLGPVTRIASGGSPSTKGSRREISLRRRAISLPRAPEPRPASHGTADSHDHIEVVAVHQRQVGNRHAAQSAYSVGVSAAGTSDLCEHPRIAGSTPYNSAFVFLAMPIARHAQHNDQSDCAVQLYFVRRQKPG